MHAALRTKAQRQPSYPKVQKGVTAAAARHSTPHTTHPKNGTCSSCLLDWLAKRQRPRTTPSAAATAQKQASLCSSSVLVNATTHVLPHCLLTHPCIRLLPLPLLLLTPQN
jgi:hypothetical protein